MGIKLRWLLLLSCLYISVEAHAYGYRPQQQPVRPPVHVVRRPSTYSYVRPAARGISPQQPAVRYVSPSILPAVKYVQPAAVPNYAATTVPPVAISTASYKSGDYVAGTLVSSTTSAPYTAEVVYYTTEPVYYTSTSANSYYAQLPAGSGTTESPYYTGPQYTYVDAGTYFGEDVAQQFTEPPVDVYASADYVAAVPGDYVPAGTGAYAPAVPADYANAVEAHYMDAGYDAGTAYYPYTDPTEYYAAAAGTEHYAQDSGYYTESAPVYDGQQQYVAGSYVYVTDVPVYSNEYATAVAANYYANLAAGTATFSPFSAANVQYVA